VTPWQPGRHVQAGRKGPALKALEVKREKKQALEKRVLCCVANIALAAARRGGASVVCIRWNNESHVYITMINGRAHGETVISLGLVSARYMVVRIARLEQGEGRTKTETERDRGPVPRVK
jgi:hypothetical protein